MREEPFRASATVRQEVAMVERPWQINLLGDLKACRDGHVIRRFRTQQTGLLLAYLAYYPKKDHPREWLRELIWPEDDSGLRDQRKRQGYMNMAVCWLRRELEPPDVPSGSVLYADRAQVRLRPEAIKTDVADFEFALQSATRTTEDAERLSLLASAIALYRGDLLPGYDATWIIGERERLTNTYIDAIRRIVFLLSKKQCFDQAIDYARRALDIAPLREDVHYFLMQLYAATGQPSTALYQYRELERLLKEELNTAPSTPIRHYKKQLQKALTQEAEFRESKGAPVSSGLLKQPSRHTPLVQQNDLPIPLTFFFGREHELVQLQAILTPSADSGSTHSRLLSLIGGGGCGKTRLALETAVRMQATFSGGVWFVPLAEAAPHLIADAIATALHLQRSPEVDLLEQISSFLNTRNAPVLLLLDNFEHLVGPGKPILLTLMRQVPTLTCFVTSRRLLELEGERPFPVVPLPIPMTTDTPESLMACASVQLFVDRARAKRPGFEVTPENRASIAGICRLLEGVPLAIELAAARVKAKAPAQIEAALSRSFKMLATRSKDQDARHRSLRAAMEWSYRLLSSPIQRFFLRLSIFQGSWTETAAEAVCETNSALAYLEILASHSLIVAIETGSEMRFRLLEPLREFAFDHLTQKGRTATARRHAAYYLQLAESEGTALQGLKQRVWFDRLATEHDNFQAALHWCLYKTQSNVRRDEDREAGVAVGRVPPDVETALRLTLALLSYWDLRGHYAEGVGWFTTVLEWSGGAPPALRAQLLCEGGQLEYHQGNYERGCAHLEESWALYEEAGNKRGMAKTLMLQGSAMMSLGDTAAGERRYEESLALFREVGDTWGIAWVLNHLGYVHWNRLDMDIARACFEESLALSSKIEDDRLLATALDDFGNFVCLQGDYPHARALYAESLAIRRKMNHKAGIAKSRQQQGLLAFHQGEYAEARACYVECLALFRELGKVEEVLLTLGLLLEVDCGEGSYAAAHARFAEALTLLKKPEDREYIYFYFRPIAEGEGNYELAHTICMEAMRRYEAIGVQSGIAHTHTHLGHIACAQKDFKAAEGHYARSLPLFLKAADRKSSIECLEGVAQMAVGREEWKRAAQLLGAAESLRASIGAPLSPVGRAAVKKNVAAVRRHVDAEAFTMAWDRGRAMTLEEAVIYARQREEESAT
jgi:predicted ATPase/DNA-binding SARP family transcriptional activator